MQDLNEELMARVTGLSGSAWADRNAVEEALLWLTDPGSIEQMTEVEKHLLPMAVAAVRSALAGMKETV